MTMHWLLPAGILLIALSLIAVGLWYRRYFLARRSLPEARAAARAWTVPLRLDLEAQGVSDPRLSTTNIAVFEAELASVLSDLVRQFAQRDDYGFYRVDGKLIEIASDLAGLPWDLRWPLRALYIGVDRAGVQERDGASYYVYNPHGLAE